ncbi:MAG: hypothetical protein E7103_01845 [Prevotella sp.]|jgi:uncharacterized membrane protein|nr:hypothetical protein [Prevotella sp.]
MAYIFEDWKTLLEKFQKCVDQGVEEMHQQKAEVQQIKKEIFNRLDSGNIIRDDRRIVLSAPEIIIGNVDKGGTLKEETGSVIVRGHHLALEGAGESGSVITRAPLIEQKAVNPGIDGRENVVSNTSQIVSQACSIMLHSSDATDEFSQIPSHPGRGGISIHADSQLDFEAAVSAENRKKQIEDTLTALDKQSGYLKSSMTDQKSSVDKFISEMVKLAEKEDKLNETDNYETFVNLSEIDALHSEMDELMPALLRSIQGFIDTVSELAEVNRRKKALKAEKDKIKTGDDFKKKTTGAQMSIKAEAITVATADGDGNLHTNGEAGIRVRTPRMSMSMHDDKGALVEDGYFNVSAHDININTANPKDNDWPVEGKINIWSKEVSIEAIDYKKNDKDVLMEKELTKDGKITLGAKTIEVSTANPKGVERDEKGKLTKGEYTGDGEVTIKSKSVSIEGMDYEVKDGKQKAKALTKDSKATIRAEKQLIIAADGEGKATGSIAINAKAVSVKSMDVDKEKLTDSGLASGSTMTLVAEKMYVGQKTKSEKSKKLQLVGEELGAFGDKTLEIQQGDGKAVVQLSGGNASMGGSKSQIYGDTTINGKADIKGDVKAPKGVFDNLEAKNSFKSQNISDGIAIPGAPGGGNLSAKLKTEDAPKD